VPVAHRWPPVVDDGAGVADQAALQARPRDGREEVGDPVELGHRDGLDARLAPAALVELGGDGPGDPR
jgi:hypothetical protein